MVFTAVWGSTATAKADVKCDDHAAPNPAAPDSYQVQYNTSVAEPLTKDLATFRDAVPSNDPNQIEPAARTLSDEISSNSMMFGTQTSFGCYNHAALERLQTPTDALTRTLRAAANRGGKPPSDMFNCVTQARRLLWPYIDALNAYASQFGGQQVPQS